jgi:hypothetical protein
MALSAIYRIYHQTIRGSLLLIARLSQQKRQSQEGPDKIESRENKFPLLSIANK